MAPQLLDLIRCYANGIVDAKRLEVLACAADFVSLAFSQRFLGEGVLGFPDKIEGGLILAILLDDNPIGPSVKSKLDEMHNTVQNRNGKTIGIYT